METAVDRGIALVLMRAKFGSEQVCVMPMAIAANWGSVALTQVKRQHPDAAIAFLLLWLRWVEVNDLSDWHGIKL